MSESERVERERERERNHQEKQALVSEAFRSGGEDPRNFVDELLSNEGLSTGEPAELQHATVAKIKNLLTRDWVLANLTDAQEHDARFMLEVLKIKVMGMHPPEGGVTGKARAHLLDDQMEDLEPLSPRERVLIDDLFETLKARITRGRGGFERTQMNTNIAETRTSNDEPEAGQDGWRGLF